MAYAIFLPTLYVLPGIAIMHNSHIFTSYCALFLCFLLIKFYLTLLSITIPQNYEKVHDSLIFKILNSLVIVFFPYSVFTFVVDVIFTPKIRLSFSFLK